MVTVPYRELGVVKNATADLLMNIEMIADNRAVLKLFATKKLALLRIELRKADVVVYTTVTSLSPENVWMQELELSDLEDVYISICSEYGELLLDWKCEPAAIKEIPEAARPALAPEEIKSNEELFLTGLHLEQYRHATYSPADYYGEALKRDQGDARCNNAMGLLLFRKGQFEIGRAHV